MSVARLLLLLALCLLIRPGGVMQIIPYYQMQKYDDEITKLYDSTPATTDPDITKRVIVDSGFFLGAPYHIGALGEGEMATFDQSPLYRTDVFDCQTFVSTVLALAESKNIIEFRRNIVRIRYKDGETSYFSRNHFTSVDWNKNNKLNGYLKDITRKIRGKRGHSIALTAIAE
ncbi:MAG: DUF1460 domain-containing protein, partial [Gammaproteobacteria bacterium]|nr:DUF1460 domain-containing protein [Gammaproteobacteria bacterium]